MRKLFLPAIVATAFISGCATTIRHDKAQSIQEFAAMLHGQEIYITDVRGDSEDPEYGYKAIRGQIETVRRLCAKDGGELHGKYYSRQNAWHQRESAIRTLASGMMGGNRTMDDPSVFFCKKADVELWGLQIDHKNFRRSKYISMFGGYYIYFTPFVKVSSPQEMQRQREVSKVETEERLRRNQEEARVRMEQQKAAQAVKNERNAKFRAGLKQGDLCQWKLPQMSGIGYGMVVRIEGKLAFVQFENVTFAGQNTRYVPIEELEAREEKNSSARYSIP